MAWSVHIDSTTGKTYYFNSVTKQSYWEKPPELKSALERALEFSDWSEFIDDESGEKYYYNSATKETTWELPMEFEEIAQSMKFDQEEAEKQLLKVSSMPTIVSFETKEEAEDAWFEMLKVMGAEPTWTWDKCIRKCSGHPAYRALRSADERKEAFERWCKETIEERNYLKKEKMETGKQVLETLFREHSLDSTVSFKKCSQLFETSEDWNNLDPNTRRQVFAKLIDEMKSAEKQRAREIRKSNLSKLRTLFEKLELDHRSSWKQSLQLLQEHPDFSSDPHLPKMDLMDILIAFEDHIFAADAKFRQERNARLKSEFRKERKIRDGFRNLLKDAIRKGVMTMTSKWKDFYREYKDDERYLQMLGNPGSSPLDMFWDEQAYMEEKYQSIRRRISDFMRDAKYTIYPDTTFNEFQKRFSRELDRLDPFFVKLVFQDMLIRVKKEEQRHIEKRSRKKLDSLKQLFKKLDPPITTSMTFEQVYERLKKYPEFAESELAVQELAYEKYMKRLKKRGYESSDSENDSKKRRRKHESEEEGEVR